jgi:chaperonin GroEL
MYKEAIFENEAREKALAGVEKVYKAVSSTLGPKGSNVRIMRSYGGPIIIHDGINVAKAMIPMKDPMESAGAEQYVSSADKIEKLGDASTLTMTVNRCIAREANKMILAGSNAKQLAKGIELAIEEITNNIDKLTVPVKDDKDIKNVAVISAQDEEIGSLISGAFKKLGKDAIITVEESGSNEMSIDYKEGMSFDKGSVSPYFVNKPESNECVIDDPYILITDYRVSQLPEFLGFLKNYELGINGLRDEQGDLVLNEDGSVKIPPTISNTSLVVISPMFTGAPLATLIDNKLKGMLNPLVITAPGFGDKQKDILEDLAIATGGVFVSKDKGIKLSDVNVSHFGRSKRVTATQDSSTIISGAGKKADIEERASLIRAQIEKSDYAFDIEKMEERLAKLTSGIAVLNIGANSEDEIRDKKEACIDAIASAKSAISGGIIPGGEITLMEAAKGVVIDSMDDVSIGKKIVLEAIKMPFRKLMENSGYEPGQMLERVINAPKGSGVDVMDGQVKDMIKAGIIDAAGIIKTALKIAASDAIMMITCDTTIAEINDGNTE